MKKIKFKVWNELETSVSSDIYYQTGDEVRHPVYMKIIDEIWTSSMIRPVLEEIMSRKSEKIYEISLG